MNGVSKLSVTEDISLVNFKNIPRDLCISSRIMTEFAEQSINIDMISQSAPTGETADISFTVDSEQVVRALAIVQRFREQYPSLRTSVSTGCCKVQLYGEEMRTRPGVAAQAFTLVSEQNADVRLITTSEVDISLLIADHDLPAVLEALQQHFEVE